jgi:hemolysin activation/secretion protein
MYLMVHASTLYAQTASPASQEEQRQRAQQQAIERQRLQSAPNVNVQQPAMPIDDGMVPAEAPCFKLEGIALEIPGALSDAVKRTGERALSHGALRFVPDYLQRYRGQCIGRAGLNLIVRRLSALIIARGYSTTRVAVPAQDLSSGQFKLALFPGMIGAIRFADPSVRGTWRNAFPAAAGDLLDVRALEQGLEQMKRVASQDVEMEIVPGASVGVSDVVLTVKRTKPWKLTMSLDDSGLEATGRLQASLNLALDNPLGLSDIFNFSINHDVNGHTDRYGTHGNSVYYAIPWGNWTFTASGSQYTYHQQIAGIDENFVFGGNAKTFDLKAEYLFQRDRLQKNLLEFRSGKNFSQSFIDGTPIEIQHRDSSYAEVGWEHKHFLGPAQLDGTLAYRWGVPWFGAKQDLPGAANGGPTYYYRITTLDTSLSVPFQIAGQVLRYTATLRAQNSSSVLYAADYFSIGSRYTVRGFDGNTTLAAEKGAFLRNDLEFALGRSGHALYLGLDGGAVFGPNAQNLPGTRLAGAVIGLRGMPFKHAYYDVFIGGPLYQPAYFPNRWPVAGFSLSLQI